MSRAGVHNASRWAVLGLLALAGSAGAFQAVPPPRHHSSLRPGLTLHGVSGAAVRVVAPA